MRRLRVEAPAKLNLGLEVVGRRSDGYHEVVTILQAVGPVDELTLEPADELSLWCSEPELAGEDNLALAALRALREAAGATDGADLRLTKRIPAAAGLGGASSDAASALVAARRLWGLATSDDELARVAAGLGSDVPFFLRGGTALATGRGELLEPLSTPGGVWAVVVSPRVTIPRKTATLYAALRPADFSDGAATREQARRLREGKSLDPGLLRNAFQCALTELHPEVAAVATEMRRAGAPFVALTGAGPSHWTVVDDPEAARFLTGSLGSALGEAAVVVVGEPVGKPPEPVPA